MDPIAEGEGGTPQDPFWSSVFSQACLSVLSTSFFRVRARNFFGFCHGRASVPTFPIFPASGSPRA